MVKNSPHNIEEIPVMSVYFIYQTEAFLGLLNDQISSFHSSLNSQPLRMKYKSTQKIKRFFKKSHKALFCLKSVLKLYSLLPTAWTADTLLHQLPLCCYDFFCCERCQIVSHLLWVYFIYFSQPALALLPP